MTNKSDKAQQRITLERTYRSSLERVWDLWTTKAGIESWWGPEGFDVVVRQLELRPGGILHYTMTATAAEQVAFMQREGMPLATEVTVTFTQVEPKHQLGFTSMVDFVNGVSAYEMNTLIELEAIGEEVHMTVTFDAMHDDQWTERARAGHESELVRLTEVLARD